MSIADTASTSHRSANGWTGSTRRSRSVGRCSPRTGRASRAATTGNRSASTLDDPSRPAGRGSSSAAEASSGPSASSRATRTSVTGSPSARRPSSGSATCWRGTARRSGATPGRSFGRCRRPSWWSPTRRPAPSFFERMPPERRAVMAVATPERAAEVIRGYVALGFGGFTFGNTQLPDGRVNQLAGEVLNLLRRGRGPVSPGRGRPRRRSGSSMPRRNGTDAPGRRSDDRCSAGMGPTVRPVATVRPMLGPASDTPAPALPGARTGRGAPPSRCPAGMDATNAPTRARAAPGHRRGPRPLWSSPRCRVSASATSRASSSIPQTSPDFRDVSQGNPRTNSPGVCVVTPSYRGMPRSSSTSGSR